VKEILIGSRDNQMLNRGLFYGENIFTSFSSFEGKVPFFSAHLQRLKDGLSLFYPRLEFESALKETQRQIESLLRNLSVGQYFRITPLVSLDKLSITIQINYKDYENKFLLSKKLVSAPDYTFSKLNKITKLGQYAESFLAKEKWQKNGYDDFLKISEEGKILEASTSNIIFLEGDKIYSPLNDEKNPYLDGITLSKIPEERIFRRDIFLEDIEKYEYCFLTNSVDFLVNVQKVDNVEFKKVEAETKKYWLRKILDFQ